MRTVDADELLKSVRESAKRAEEWLADCKAYHSAMTARAEQAILTFNECALRIKNAPTVDAEPVKRGHWIYHPDWQADGECGYECSACGMGSDVDYQFCMRCGAKMDGKEGDQNG